MNYNKNVKVETNRKTIEEIRQEKRILMILKEVNEELFGDRVAVPANQIKHSTR